MSETENEETTSPRISKAIIGRILAVGLFVALGTFAVIHSMNGKDPDAAVGSDEGGDDASLAQKVDGAIEDGKKKVSDVADSLAGVFEKDDKTKNAEPKSFTPPSSRFGGGINTTPATSSKPLAGNPPPVRSFGAGTAAKKPPGDRFAQANSGVPVIKSSNGFGELKKPVQFPGTGAPDVSSANPPKTGFGGGIGAKFNDVAKSTNNSATNLKNQATSKVDNLLKKAGDKGNEFAGSLRPNAFNPNAFKPDATKPGASTSNAFGDTARRSGAANQADAAKPGFGARSGFGAKAPANPNTEFSARPGTENTFGAPTGQAAKSAPPIVTSNFGGRPTGAPTGATQQPKALAGFDSSRSLAPINRPPTNPFGNNEAKSSTTRAQVPGNDPFADPNTSAAGNASVNANSSRQTMTPRTFPSPQQSGSSSNLRSNVPAQPASTTLGGNRPTSRLAGGSSLSGASLETKDTPGERDLDGVQAPSLTIEKLSPREIQVNQTADFELVIRNVGRATAEEVRVFDEVPAGTDFKGAAPEPSQMSQNRSIEWNIGQLRPGQEKRIKYQLQPNRPGEIGSVAQVTFSTRASMRTLVTKPVLEIVHQTNPIHLIGDNVVLDVIVKNIGDGAAKNVMIQQEVPKQLDFPDGLPGGNRGIEYEIGTLMPGKSQRIQLSLKAANVGKIQNVMYASADGGLRAEHKLPMEIVAPKLVARTDGPTIRYLNRNVTHSFSVANQGTAKATNVEMIARLPPGLRFVSANNQGRYDPNSNSVYWSLAELARDVEANVELTTTPVAVGSQPIKFESFADLKIRSSAEHPMNVQHLVDVFFDIDDVVDPIEIGADTSYRVRVVNQGTKAATNVQLQVDFPPGLQPTTVEGSLRHNIRGQQIAFEPINSMSPGDEISIIIRAKGQAAGDHRVTVNMQTDGRSTPVSKQETTRVYSDR